MKHFYVVNLGIFANTITYGHTREKNELYLIVNAFSTKFRISPSGDEPSFYVVITTTRRRSSHLQGKGNTLISKSVF